MKKFLDYSEAQEYLNANREQFSEQEEKSDDGGFDAEGDQEVWYYAVAVGRSPGIYSDREDATAQVHGFSGFRMKKFLDWDEAQAFVDFNRVYSSEEEESDDEEDVETWYYAVAVGRSPGVYANWQIAMDQVRGFSGFRMKKFLIFSEAQAFVDEFQNQDESEEEEPEAEEAIETYHYVVLVGQNKGIFTDVKDALAHAREVPGGKVYKLSSYEAARDYLRQRGLEVRSGLQYTDASRLWFAYERAGYDLANPDPRHPDTLVAFCSVESDQSNGDAAYVCVFPHKRDWDVVRSANPWTSSDRAGYLATLAALRTANAKDGAAEKAMHIYTTRRALFNTMSDRLFVWKDNDWYEDEYTEVAERDVLEQVYGAYGGRAVVWHYHPRATTSGKRDWATCYMGIAELRARNAARLRAPPDCNIFF
jgi:viroplasmin and RNaseH domain-containing protein/ribonuclease HI